MQDCIGRYRILRASRTNDDGLYWAMEEPSLVLEQVTLSHFYSVKLGNTVVLSTCPKIEY